MKYRFVFAGSGGQGILSMGQLLSYAAMLEEKEVTFMPSYGPEMRGGSADCTVVISDKTISCPLVNEAEAVLIMSARAMEKFEPLCTPGGKLFINRSLVSEPARRDDVQVVDVDCNTIAADLGNERSANIVMLGAIVKETGVVSLDSVEKVLAKTFSGRKAKLLPGNVQALHSWVQ